MRRLAGKIRRGIQRLFGREFPPRLDIQLPTVHLGSDYGGWDVHPAGLDGDSVIYSAGIGEDASFDVELIRLLGARVHGFDPTPRSIEWVKQASLGEEFWMHEFGLAGFDGEARLYAPTDRRHVSHTMLDGPASSGQAIDVPVLRLSTIAARLGHERIDLLKMDIEGAEYQVIDDMVATGVRPGQLLVEFHHRSAGVGVGRTRRAVRQLRRLGYRLFHVSINGEEFSFIQPKARSL